MGRFVALLATAVLLSGCSTVVAGNAQPAVGPVPGASGRSAPPSADSRSTPAGVDPVELDQDITTAEQVVNAFWTRHWTENFPAAGAYKSPTVVGLYDGRAPDPKLPTCGGKALPPDNALYCPSGDFVAWDVGLMARGLKIGDAWVYLIVAHEWGHAVQARIGATMTAQQRELQADCFAGAALYGATADGMLKIDAGDVKEITVSLTAASDETPWTSSTDHGDPFQRIEAFDRGRTGGVPACIPRSG